MGNFLITCRLEKVTNVSCYNKKDGSIKFRIFPENKDVPPNTNCYYKILKINAETNDIITDFTEITVPETTDILTENLGPGTYQVNIYIQESDDPPLQISSCIGNILEPDKLQVMIYNKEKINNCKLSANVMVVGGIGPYTYYLNCTELSCVDRIYYCDCEKNVLKVIDDNGNKIKKYL
jgi:hypothetical protein